MARVEGRFASDFVAEGARKGPGSKTRITKDTAVKESSSWCPSNWVELARNQLDESWRVSWRGRALGPAKLVYRAHFAFSQRGWVSVVHIHTHSHTHTHTHRSLRGPTALCNRPPRKAAASIPQRPYLRVHPQRPPVTSSRLRTIIEAPRLRPGRQQHMPPGTSPPSPN